MPTRNYEVVIDQSREVVRSVAVKVGDTVEQGDVLFRLADKVSVRTQAARSALTDLNYQYQEAVINASNVDYARETGYQLAREALREA
jgi:multidrug efflux pump subunit AcrA (membrane-fusion protein)